MIAANFDDSHRKINERSRKRSNTYIIALMSYGLVCCANRFFFSFSILKFSSINSYSNKYIYWLSSVDVVVMLYNFRELDFLSHSHSGYVQSHFFLRFIVTCSSVSVSIMHLCIVFPLLRLHLITVHPLCWAPLWLSFQ